MWRRHAQKTSRAEEQIFAELCRRGLGRLLSTQHGLKFNQEADGVRGTFVDFLWAHPAALAVFIDGEQIHLKREKKDSKIDEALRGLGYDVKRFSYRPPLRKRRLREICDSIEKRVREG